MPTKTKQRYTIKFRGCRFTFNLQDVEDLDVEDLDAEFDRVVLVAEQRLGRKLSLSERTGFPEFTLFEYGEEIGGG